MGIVIKAFILCTTDDPDEAASAVFSALNGGVFESSSPILDFVAGVEQAVPLAADYVDGSFVRMVPAATLLRTANSSRHPCEQPPGTRMPDASSQQLDIGDPNMLLKTALPKLFRADSARAAERGYLHFRNLVAKYGLAYTVTSDGCIEVAPL